MRWVLFILLLFFQSYSDYLVGVARISEKDIDDVCKKYKNKTRREIIQRMIFLKLFIECVKLIEKKNMPPTNYELDEQFFSQQIEEFKKQTILNDADVAKRREYYHRIKDKKMYFIKEIFILDEMYMNNKFIQKFFENSVTSGRIDFDEFRRMTIYSCRFSKECEGVVGWVFQDVLSDECLSKIKNNVLIFTIKEDNGICLYWITEQKNCNIPTDEEIKEELLQEKFNDQIFAILTHVSIQVKEVH